MRNFLISARHSGDFYKFLFTPTQEGSRLKQFTNIFFMWYNPIVKKLALITISLCVALGAVFGTAFGSAFADESFSTFYPEAFEPCTLLDYAVNEKAYAYTDGKIIAVYKDGSDKPDYPECKQDVAALGCKDGKFVYQSGEKVYDLETGDEVDYLIAKPQLPVSVNGYSYTITPEKSIKTMDGSGQGRVIEGEFSNLKVFDNTVYAVSGNYVNKITPPAECEKVPYEIADYSSANRIRVGETLSALITYNFEKLHYSTLKNGEPLTEVYLDGENFPKTVKPSDYFQTGETFTVGSKKDFSAGLKVFVLCKTGNADIISVNGKFYIKLGGEVTERELATPEYESAIINVAKDFAYSSPVMLDSTTLFAVHWGEKIKVLGKVEKDVSSQIATAYYKIALLDEDGSIAKDENGEQMYGFVPCSFVTERADNNDQTETPDPDYKDGNVIRTVVLVLIVVALVLIAAGYITFVFTKGKPKN